MVLLEGGWRFKRCCCFDVKTGTTILGVIQILGGTLWLIFALIAAFAVGNAKDAQGKPAFTDSEITTLVVTFIVVAVLMLVNVILSAFLIYGNSNDAPKYMIPTVYWNITTLILGSIMQIITLSVGEGEAIVGIVQILIGLIVGLLFVQVIRSRIADIEEGA